MTRKRDASIKFSDDKLNELLSREDDKLKKIIIFMKSTIKETNLPWVSWKFLEDNAGKIIGNSRHPGSDLWAIMKPHTYSIGEKDTEVVNPEFYEYKIGNAWVYIPVEMISLYCGKDE